MNTIRHIKQMSILAKKSTLVCLPIQVWSRLDSSKIKRKIQNLGVRLIKSMK